MKVKYISIRSYGTSRVLLANGSTGVSQALRRVLQPPDSNNTMSKSTLEMWRSHLGSVTNTRKQLERYQNIIMSKIDVVGEKVNTLTEHGVNQWHFSNPAATASEIPTLMLHGYASSSMSFYRNIAQMSKCLKDIYIIDLPSNGLSKTVPLNIQSPCQRAPFTFTETDMFKLRESFHYDMEYKRIKEYEDYYVEGVEQWRQDNNLNKINLIGHSFGGFIAYHYALKYPEHIRKLALVSPIGVERNIFSINNNFKPGSMHCQNFDDPLNTLYSNKRKIPKFIFKNQLKVLRWIGPIGAKFCWNYINISYKRVPSRVFKEYVFELLYGKGGISNESMAIFTNLFSTNLLAKDPILDSISDLKVDDLIFIYGEFDWMNKYAGQLAVDRVQRAGKSNAEYIEVANAGHNLFLDNPEAFNNRIISFLK